jgi:hypothetical protein
MAGAFQLLRSNDLIWSRVAHDYLMGERAPPNDLMSWNADATRLPYRMHSEYLRRLFLHNDLAEGRYKVGGRPIALSDIHAPIFAVGTIRDHVAPWRSVYKVHYQVDADVTFLLASGGHNAGIVAPPGEEEHFYQVKSKPEDAPYVGSDEWLKLAPRTEGSWWPEWARWSTARSGPPGEPPRMGPPADRICQTPPANTSTNETAITFSLRGFSNNVRGAACQSSSTSAEMCETPVQGLLRRSRSVDLCPIHSAEVVFLLKLGNLGRGIGCVGVAAANALLTDRKVSGQKKA